MVAYIQQLVIDLANRIEHPFDVSDVDTRVKALVEELDRLDPRDFVPATRASFVDLRRMARNWSCLPSNFWICVKHFHTSNDDITGAHTYAMAASRLLDDPKQVMCFLMANDPNHQFAYAEFRKELIAFFKRLRDVLSSYGGKDCRLVLRSFPFVHNTALRSIIERDYRELSMVLFPGGAWKSTVVIAGSILEAILYDQLTKDAGAVAASMVAVKSPKKGPKTARVTRDIQSDKPEDDWKLKDLIEVSIELGIITKDRGNTIDQILRDFRNFVHARAELKSGHDITEAEATLAKGALDGVCNLLKP